MDYKEFLNSTKFSFNDYDEEIKFELLNNEGELEDEVMDISLESAIEYFKDNFDGTYTIIFEGGKFNITL